MHFDVGQIAASQMYQCASLHHVSVLPRLTPICTCVLLEQLLLSKYFSQCSQDMVISFYSCRGAHLTRQRKVKIICSTYFTHSNGYLQNCNSTCPSLPTCLKLSLFLILSGTPGAGVDGGGGMCVNCGVCRAVLLPLMEGTGGKGPFFRAREMDAPAALGNVWDTRPVKYARALS